MAVALKLDMFDPMLVKPKSVWEAVGFFLFPFFFQFSAGVNTLSKLKLESKLKKQTDFGDVFKN